MINSKYNCYDVVLVKFPFTDLESSKKRPALVLNAVEFHQKTQLVTIAMISSRVDDPSIDGDYKIKHWEEAHLLHPSIIRLSKVATVESSVIDKKLGVLSKKEINGVKTNFKKLFKQLL